MSQPDHIVPALYEALAKPPEGVEVTNRTVILTPEDIAEIISRMCYSRQRRIQPSHVGMIADMMLAEQYAPGDQITFAIEEGIPKLVDGQHRLQAAITAGWVGLWSVRCLWTEQFAADKMYLVIDTSQKPRTSAVVGHAAGYDQLSPRTQNAIIAAPRYQNMWRGEYEIPDLCSAPPIRDNVDRANARIKSFEKADQILNDRAATPHIKRRLATPMVLAIITETLTSSPWEAAEFWPRVATNGDKIAGELRNSLIQGPPARASAFFTARLAAHAWNQRKSNGKMRRENQQSLPLQNTSLVIPA